MVFAHQLKAGLEARSKQERGTGPKGTTGRRSERSPSQAGPARAPPLPLLHSSPPPDGPRQHRALAANGAPQPLSFAQAPPIPQLASSFAVLLCYRVHAAGFGVQLVWFNLVCV